MALPDVFDPDVTAGLRARLERLAPTATPHWGSLDAARMLAHCCVPYEQLRGSAGGGPLPLRWLARLFFKGSVVGERPFRRNLPTAPQFVITDPREFEKEKARLLTYMAEFHGLGREAFEGRVHVTFGALTARQWSNLLWKHLDHHLRQFGA